MTPKTRLSIAIAGSLLAGGFFLPWVDVGGEGFRVAVSGAEMVRHGELSAFYAMVLLVPLLGAAMVVRAAPAWRNARLLSVATGSGLAAYASYKIAQAFCATTGWG